MNNAIEQDHHRVKRRIRSMLGFKSAVAVDITLSGIELIHMMRKQQGVFATAKPFSLNNNSRNSQHSRVQSSDVFHAV